MAAMNPTRAMTLEQAVRAALRESSGEWGTPQTIIRSRGMYRHVPFSEADGVRRGCNGQFLCSVFDAKSRPMTLHRSTM